MMGRLLATQTVRTLAQDYRAQIEQRYLETKEDKFWEAAVDVAALGTGPIAALEEAFFGEVEKTLAVKLIESGANSLLLSSIKAAIKPTGSPLDVLNQLTTIALEEGLSADVAMTAIKEGAEALFGKVVAESVFGLYDFIKFKKSAYNGWSELDAMREIDHDLGL